MTKPCATNLTDDQLMSAFGRGDKAAFDQIYFKFKQPIYQYLYRNCNNTHSTDDLFQDVWLRVSSSAKRYQNKGRFRSWLFTLAHNCLVDYYRKSGKLSLQDPLDLETEAEIIFSVSEGQATNTDLISDTRQIASITAILETLPAAQREAFYLRQESDFSIIEIAEIQHISAEAAKSRLRYAYGKLRNALKDTNL